MLAADTKAVEVVPTPATELPPSWKQIVEPVGPFLDQVTKRLAEQVQTFDPEIAPYAQYALTNQGKQLRPVLVALSARTIGTVNDNLVTAAVIIDAGGELGQSGFGVAGRLLVCPRLEAGGQLSHAGSMPGRGSGHQDRLFG